MDECLPAGFQEVLEGVLGGKVEDPDPHKPGTGTAGNPAVQLAEEHKDILLSTWRDVWHDQLRQQVNQTVEQQAIETASQSTSQDYAAAARLSRFLTRSILPTMQGKSRVSTTGWLVLSMSIHVEELMRDMSLDHQEAAEVTNQDTMNAQVTPQKKKMDLTESTKNGASASSHPFPSEAALKQAVENAKISHIHHGGFSTDYTEQQWESYVKTRQSRAAGH